MPGMAWLSRCSRIRHGAATTYKAAFAVGLWVNPPTPTAGQGSQVEEGLHAPQRFNAASGGEIGPVDIAAIAQEDPNVSPSSVVTPKSLLKPLPAEENHGIVQPMRFLYASIFASGAIDTKANEVSRA